MPDFFGSLRQCQTPPLPAMCSSERAEIDDVITCSIVSSFMLDDENGVSEIAKMVKRFE